MKIVLHPDKYDVSLIYVCLPNFFKLVKFV